VHHLLLMPIRMMLLALLLPPLGFLLPPPLGLLSISPLFPSLHRIFKSATHIRCHLDHFFSLAISCMWLLPMNINPLCSSPIYILFGIVNKSYNFGLSIRWPQIIHQSLFQVVHKIWVKHPYYGGIHFVFLHVIFQCPISHSNIVFCIYHFHLFFIHY
jgi:hypothetical protein